MERRINEARRQQLPSRFIYPSLHGRVVGHVLGRSHGVATCVDVAVDDNARDCSDSFTRTDTRDYKNLPAGLGRDSEMMFSLVTPALILCPKIFTVNQISPPTVNPMSSFVLMFDSLTVSRPSADTVSFLC